jgi:hypothetical protein
VTQPAVPPPTMVTPVTRLNSADCALTRGLLEALAGARLGTAVSRRRQD